MLDPRTDLVRLVDTWDRLTREHQVTVTWLAELLLDWQMAYGRDERG